MTDHFVAYYRVSTDKQGRSGLGLDAQRAAVEAHVAGARGAVAFIEIESGRKKDRPSLLRRWPLLAPTARCWSSPSSTAWPATSTSCPD